ncbi:transposase [Pseudoxanthomonas sp. CAU 1598]|uniref:Transposase n=2 Tax=Pseudomarimonas arenosa TaxID=2774145 RepID=A0AAW3ZQQ3_9GAMM|nr:transposase [Pseudomarimonas arenosa]
MPKYQRLWLPGSCHFFTVAIRDREGSLLTDHIADLRTAFARTRRDRPFDLQAIVVLPDHLHCVWQLPPGDADNATRWRQIKSLFSRGVSCRPAVSRSLRDKRERGLWQRRYWDHLIRDENDLARHVDYIHYNPVKHGCSKTVADWRYSSFHRYVEQGKLPQNWGEVEEPVSRLKARE